MCYNLLCLAPSKLVAFHYEPSLKGQSESPLPRFLPRQNLGDQRYQLRLRISIPSILVLITQLFTSHNCITAHLHLDEPIASTNARHRSPDLHYEHLAGRTYTYRNEVLPRSDSSCLLHEHDDINTCLPAHEYCKLLQLTIDSDNLPLLQITTDNPVTNIRHTTHGYRMLCVC